tara:strand:- start:454 stop:930 length:477 start_codon:yes stop_codon:yes gene_type:complete
MGFVHDRPATHLAPQTVVAQVFGPEHRDADARLRSHSSASTGMHPGAEADGAAVQVALRQLQLTDQVNKGLIASIALVLAIDDEIKDLNEQRERIANETDPRFGEGTPLLWQVYSDVREKLDARRAEAMNSLAESLIGQKSFPVNDLRELMRERASQQ